ncbi:hypothetical protein ACYOEI_05740 [Singulisphaera rosea]
MHGQGEFASLISQMFKSACRKAGLNAQRLGLSAESFRPPGNRQLQLFD